MATGQADGGELVGRVLAGRYRVTAQLGRGGMGVVCRAVDQRLGREVAVKVLRAYNDASPAELADLRTRMEREARAAARIRHGGVITVHDVTDEDGCPVIVMEFIDGPSLDGVLNERGAMDPREAAAIGAKVMDALDAAHRAGVLHRDVKPGNVLLDRTGRVVLTDFGIASMEAPGDEAATKLTRSGELVGSLDFLPPERAQGDEPGPASDIWSLGMTLYAAVEGDSPFRRSSVWSTLNAIVTDPLPEPRRAGPLAPVLQALMAKDPAARPSAAQAHEMLQAVAAGRTMNLTPLPVGTPLPFQQQTPAAPSGPTPPAASAPTVPGRRPTAALPARRGPRRALAVAAAVAVLAAGGVAYALVGTGGASGGGSRARAAASSADASQGISPGPGKDGLTTPEPSAPASSPPVSRPASSGSRPQPGAGNPRGTRAPAPACTPIAGGRFDCAVWHTASSYTRSGAQAGTLHAGSNYFFCQADLGRRETYGRWTNVWWAKTDDDSGNSGVYVSDVYLKGGADDQPLPGLPVC